MGFEAIQIDSAPGALVEQVLARIKSGDLHPGTCLPSQRELAKLFRVGLGSVREAIKILTVMGHLEVIRGKGTFVSPASPKVHEGWTREDPTLQADIQTALEAVSLADLLQTREIMECGAARLAAQTASRAHIEHLENVGAALTTTPESVDIYYNYDFAFHLAVAEATNNRALLKMLRQVVERVHHCLDFMNQSLGIALPLNIERCVRSARRVINCIVVGEAERASSAMNAHLNVVRFQLDQKFPIRDQGTGAAERAKPDIEVGGE